MLKEKKQMNTPNTNTQLMTLSNRMAKLFAKNYLANRNHINKIAAQMRYLEKQVRPEVVETKD